MSKILSYSEKVIASLGIDVRSPYDKGRTLTIFDDIERDLLEFLRYIPLEYYPGAERKGIYSPDLENMLLVIGSRIDSFFRYWDVVLKKNLKQIRDPKQGIDKLTFGNYKSIEEDIRLHNQKVVLSHSGEIIRPFYNWNRDIPEDLNEYDEERHGPLWLKAYNNVKHRGYFERKLGNLDNVVKSLGALFILNCEHVEVWNYLMGREYIDKPFIIPDPIRGGDPRDPFTIIPQIDTTPFLVYHAFAKSKLFRLSTHIEVKQRDYYGFI